MRILVALFLCAFIPTMFCRAERAHADGALPHGGIPLPSEATVAKLSNGMRVLIKKDTRFPLVSLRLYVHAGSVLENTDQLGISHLLEHMVFKGTEHRPRGGVAGDIERSGGYVNAATSFDYTVYLADMPSSQWRLGLDVLRDMAFHASIDQDELNSEKEVVIAELKRGEDTPASRLFTLSQARSLKGSSYALPIIGYEPVVRAISKAMIHNYVATHYRPQAMFLLLCGDVDEKEVLLEVEKQFGLLEAEHFPLPEQFKPLNPPAVAAALHVDAMPYVEEGAWNKIYLALSLPAASFSDPRSAQLDVLAQLLGGDPSSKFYHKYVYKKQLLDSLKVHNFSLEGTGLLYITAILDADKLELFWEEFTKDLAQANEWHFSAEELERAKLNIQMDLFRSMETLAGYASKVGYFQFFGSEDYNETSYLGAVKSTTAAELSALAGDLFAPEHMATVCLMPKGGWRDKAKAADLWMADILHKNFPVGQTKKKIFGALPHSEWTQYASIFASEKPSLAHSKAQTPELVSLGSGRTLILLPDTTLPFAAVTLRYQGGNALLTPSEAGLGAFTASLLKKGTAHYSATEFEQFLADRAAHFSARSHVQTFSLDLNVPSQFLPDMMDLLNEIVTQPSFLPGEADWVRQNQAAAIALAEDQPTSLAFRRLLPLLFPSHSYGIMQLGNKESVQKFTAGDAKAFWERQKRFPWTLVVCGTFDREEVLRQAEKISPPQEPVFKVPFPQWGQEKQLRLHLPEREQAHLMLVFPTVPLDAPEEPGLDLLQQVLAGQSGLLFAELRDKKGLGYSVAAFPWRAQQAGFLGFYIGTDPKKLLLAEQGIEEVLQSLRTDLLDPADLTRGKNQMLSSYYREHQTLASRAAEAAQLHLLGKPLNAAQQLVEKAQSLSAQDLQRLAKKYLKSEKAYSLVVLPQGE